MKKLFPFIPLIIVFFSCLSEETEFAGYTSPQVVQLITADTLKAWEIGSVNTGNEMVPPGGADSCYYRYRYFFTNIEANDSLTVYLRTDPTLTCQADTIAFYWTPSEREEDEGFAVAEPRLLVGTDSGNVYVRVRRLTSDEMEWELLQQDGETSRSPARIIQFLITND
ncbi:hypothetical protein AB9P05_17560 [Roseivirga sp. BDSF3-8]|uniref:hypothetical protein n=1 Tax=Roseivirga sp. BDSF3-8 TaxID=3241598 RepID=UPI0035321235